MTYCSGFPIVSATTFEKDASRAFCLSSVLDRWYQIESKPEWPRADYFKVWAADEREYLLKHDLESDEWFLGQHW